MPDPYIDQFLEDAGTIIERLDRDVIASMVDALVSLRERGGRLFCVGVGGGAAHASHAVTDFRKIAGIEAYAPTDNVGELTARTNDEGWDTSLREYLRGSRLDADDAVMVFSVGGGDLERNISANVVRAVEHAREVGAQVYGIVGRDGGYTARVADFCIVVPPVNAETVTAQTESFQALIWHVLVSHPGLMQHGMKWESTTGVTQEAPARE